LGDAGHDLFGAFFGRRNGVFLGILVVFGIFGIGVLVLGARGGLVVDRRLGLLLGRISGRLLSGGSRKTDRYDCQESEAHQANHGLFPSGLADGGRLSTSLGMSA